MTTLSAVSSSPIFPTRSLTTHSLTHHGSLLCKSSSIQQNRICNKPISSFTIRAAKVPAGVEFPKVKPRFTPPFLGFTKTAEIWNSRACMIGLIGTFIVELILNKGILQIIGIEVGKGLDIPL